jgi:N-acetylmuramoyl-L-alanine amidase
MIGRPETKYIVIHATMDDTDFSLSELQWRDRRYGYLDARYHWLIRRDGTAHRARDERLIGMGTRPHNSTSVSVLLNGTPEFTQEQMATLEDVVGKLSCLYPDALVCGYRDLPGTRAKGSPGFDVQAWDIGRRAGLTI